MQALARMCVRAYRLRLISTNVRFNCKQVYQHLHCLKQRNMFVSFRLQSMKVNEVARRISETLNSLQADGSIVQKLEALDREVDALVKTDLHRKSE
jgi:hypothetical protein